MKKLANLLGMTVGDLADMILECPDVAVVDPAPVPKPTHRSPNNDPRPTRQRQRYQKD